MFSAQFKERHLEGGVSTSHRGDRTIKRHATGEHLKERHAKGVDIGAGGDEPIEHLRGHICGRARGECRLSGIAADGAVGAFAGEAEVSDEHATIAREHDVAGFNVPVHDAARVKCAHGLAHMDHDLAGGGGVELSDAVQHAGEAFTFDQFHHDVDELVVLTGGVDADEAGMLDVDDAAHAFAECFARGFAEAKQFDGDFAAEQGVPAAPDNTHAAAADFFDEVDGANAGGHGGSCSRAPT